MTIIYPETVTCGLCGEEIHAYTLTSTSSWGSPDLDMRPSEPARGTYADVLRACPYCGYVGYGISEKPHAFVTRKWVKLQRDVLRKYECGLAENFLLLYKIEEKAGNAIDAFYAALHAAWALDDELLFSGISSPKRPLYLQGAADCRKLALKHWDALFAEAKGQGAEKKENLLALKCDLLRRSGQFDKVLADYKDRKFESEIIGKIITFQLQKAAGKDTKCYTVGDALDSLGGADKP